MIRTEWVDKAKITYVSMAFPLERIHPNARPASEAAECAAHQGRFWPMHERLFAAPRGGLNITHFAESAIAIGLDLDQFKVCLSGETPSSVAAEIAEARRLHVNSTPTFFVLHERHLLRLVAERLRVIFAIATASRVSHRQVIKHRVR